MSKLHISAKCDDRCEFFTDLRYDVGYPPNITGLSGNDYIDFSIDLETGKICHWNIIKKELTELGFCS